MRADGRPSRLPISTEENRQDLLEFPGCISKNDLRDDVPRRVSEETGRRFSEENSRREDSPGRVADEKISRGQVPRKMVHWFRLFVHFHFFAVSLIVEDDNIFQVVDVKLFSRGVHDNGGFRHRVRV